MSRNRIVYTGLEELKKSLERLPTELHGEADNIIEGEANQAALQVRQAYAHVTGGLIEGVNVEAIHRTNFYAGRRVVNKSPIAFIYENGTQLRHYYTHNGVKKEVGAMPPAHKFVRIMIARRREMYAKLRDMMRRHGLKVAG